MSVNYEAATKSIALAATGRLHVEASLLDMAKQGDKEALEAMFKSFITLDDEEIIHTEYLGLQGLWGIGSHSFACVTNKRVADIAITPLLREVIYQDGYLEYINSGVIRQPSRLWLYVLWAIVVLISAVSLLGIVNDWLMPLLVKSILSLIVIVFTVLLLPLITRIFYSLKTCGLVFWVREGVPIYVFTRHNRLSKARNLYRIYSECREARIAEVGSLSGY